MTGSRDASSATALRHDDPRYQAATYFLVEEAAILDAREWERWLGLLTADISYVMPVQVAAMIGARRDRLDDMAHFDEDHYSLTKRINRLLTDHAWTEDPPSRTRHIVTNVRVFATANESELRAESSLLLFRSRGDRQPEIMCARRVDTLRDVGGDLRLAARHIEVTEAVLRTQNLAILL